MEALKEGPQPMELSEFKNMGPHMPTTVIDIPEKPENRYPTDRASIAVFAVCVLLLMPFLIYNLAYSDIRKLYDFDDCGNICGSANTKYEQWDCSGKDYTDKKYLKLVDGSLQCVEKCGDHYRSLYGVCVSADSNETDVNKDWTATRRYLSGGLVIFKLIVCSLMTVGISVAVLYVFRYAVAVVVWSIIITVFILSVILVALMWASYEAGDVFFLIVCLISTVFVVVYGVLVYLSRNRISLVIILLTEATNAVFAIPSLIVVPLCTFFADTIIITLWLTTTVYMASAGELTKDMLHDRMTYELTEGTSMTIFYNSVITLWSLFFVGGLQYMVIGGAVSEWYFAKDKTCLYQPVRRSFDVAYRFHLGTVFFGSLILTLASLLRYMIKALIKNRLTQACVDYCLRGVLNLLQYLKLYAYIVTAMHGQPFLKSGKRAAQLLATNLSDVMVLNIIVSLTLSTVILLIALASVLLSILLFMGDAEENYVTVALIIVFMMSIFAGVTFVSVIQTTIDTIFICFCEDKILNDGMARPYAMSRELMEFIDNAKKATTGNKNDYGQLIQQTPQPV